MKNRILTVLAINLLFGGLCLKPAFALEHVQKDGLFRMYLPAGWQWVEYPQEVIITLADGKTMAIDIQMAPAIKLSEAEMKRNIKQNNDKMIKDGIMAHHATLIDNKEIRLDGVYASRLDFRTAPPHPVDITYICFYNKGYAFTVLYGSHEEKMRAVMDDVLATLKFR